MKFETIASYLAGAMFILGLMLVKAPRLTDSTHPASQLKPTSDMVRK